MSKPIRRPEQAMQRAVALYLESRKQVTRDLVYCHIPNGGRRNRIEASIFAGLGVVAGAPDLVIWKRDGEVVCIELKAKGGRLTESQKVFGANLMLLGHRYHVVTAETPARAVELVAKLLEGRAA